MYVYVGLNLMPMRLSLKLVKKPLNLSCEIKPPVSSVPKITIF